MPNRDLSGGVESPATGVVAMAVALRIRCFPSRGLCVFQPVVGAATDPPPCSGCPHRKLSFDCDPASTAPLQ